MQMGDTNVLQLLVKAKALNSESSMGVTHLLETQVWGTPGMCTTRIRPVSIYLLGCCISIPSFSPVGHWQDELGYKCFLKFYRNFLAYYTVVTSHLTSLPRGYLEDNSKASEQKNKLSYLLERRVRFLPSTTPHPTLLVQFKLSHLVTKSVNE